LITDTVNFAGPIVAELTNIRRVTLTRVPQFSAYLDLEPSLIRLPQVVRNFSNGFYWEFASQWSNLAVDKPINQLRAKYNLAPRSNHKFDVNLSKRLTAVTVSPNFLPRPKDWQPYQKVTGFCFLDNSAGWEETAELTAFLDGSKPVVAICSLVLSSKFFQTGVEAVQKLGVRGLLIGATEKSLSKPAHPDVMAVTSIPLEKIIPRCAVIIHHGGIEYIEESLKVGVPSLVIPIGTGHNVNVAQLLKIGVAEYMPYNNLSVNNVVSKLGLLLKSDSPHRRAAKNIANLIAEEDGVGNLCKEIEYTLRY
jgi:rhamnosyltransferase subunit B